MRLTTLYQIIDDIQSEKSVLTSDINISMNGQTLILFTVLKDNPGIRVIGEVKV